MLQALKEQPLRVVLPDYVAWAYSPLGKTVISKRLLSRWEKDLKVDNANKKFLEKELKVLDYQQHVLLWNLTRWYLAKPSERKEKKLKKLALQLKESGIESMQPSNR